jgi:hypothetical protein
MFVLRSHCSHETHFNLSSYRTASRHSNKLFSSINTRMKNESFLSLEQPVALCDFIHKIYRSTCFDIEIIFSLQLDEKFMSIVTTILSISLLLNQTYQVASNDQKIYLKVNLQCSTIIYCVKISGITNN